MSKEAVEVISAFIYEGWGDGKVIAQEVIEALEAAGVVIVPKVATPEMLDAFNSYAQCIGYDDKGYAAMIVARPK